jgi:hypothetical protein
MSAPAQERRSNLVLRVLIDDMLDRVRELNRNATAWSVDDRERAEADLEGVMARVRRVASQGSQGTARAPSRG